jgi:hypothetical protein
MGAVFFLGAPDHPATDLGVRIGCGVDVDESVVGVDDDDIERQKIEDLR